SLRLLRSTTCGCCVQVRMVFQKARDHSAPDNNIGGKQSVRHPSGHASGVAPHLFKTTSEVPEPGDNP
ncbi:hypothetical protein NLQ89_28170, partial [Escherichia coli]|nr:hypothetical protein [Escherichia coli]